MAQHGTAWHGWYVWDLCEADSLAYGAAGSSGRVISVALVMCCTSLRFGKRFLTVDFYTYSSYFFMTFPVVGHLHPFGQLMSVVCLFLDHSGVYRSMYRSLFCKNPFLVGDWPHQQKDK